MTTDLPPGPELDALVAEVVMEWAVTRYPFDPLTWPGPWPALVRNEKDGGGPFHHIYRSPENGPLFDWSPSTDWRAAGEVLDRMDAHAPNVWRSLSDEGPQWGACMGADISYGQTGPHAISLAAYAAKRARGA